MQSNNNTSCFIENSDQTESLKNMLTRGYLGGDALVTVYHYSVAVEGGIQGYMYVSYCRLGSVRLDWWLGGGVG